MRLPATHQRFMAGFITAGSRIQETKLTARSLTTLAGRGEGDPWKEYTQAMGGGAGDYDGLSQMSRHNEQGNGSNKEMQIIQMTILCMHICM